MGNMTTDLVSEGLKILEARLPQGWTIESYSRSESRYSSIDLWAQISAPDGRRAEVAVEAKSRFEPRDAMTAVTIASTLGDAGSLLVISPFLSKATRERLQEGGLNWLDLSGNVRLVVDEPGLFVATEGAARRPGTTKRPARSLKGPSAGRVVRALLAAKLPIGVSDLANQANANPGYVSRILELLNQRALVERKPRGPVLELDRVRLMRQWAEEAPLSTRGKVQTYLEPRGIPGLLKKLRQANVPYALTGSLAAQRYAPVAPPRLAQLYVGEDPEDVATQLELKATDAGANVQLIRPDDMTILETAQRADDGLSYVTPVQTVADLLTSPGRGPVEGDELLRWMLGREDTWRG
jgi:hypothetical protein